MSQGSADVGVGPDVGLSGCVPTTPGGPAAPPVFAPCPDEWSEVMDPASCVTTCEPPEDWNPAAPPEGVPTGNPAAAVNWPCPDGWHATTVGDTTHCEPYGPDGPETCGPNEAHFPGSPGCATIGTPCPQGDFPEGLPTDVPIVYVKPGTPGAGTRASPYGSIDEVPFETLAAGTVVALAKGTYEGLVAPRGTVTLWGACVAETVLTSQFRAVPGSFQGVVQVARSGVDLTVKNLRIANSRDLGVWLAGGSAPTKLRQVVIEQVTGLGVLVTQRASLDAEEVIIRDTRSFPGGVAGQGLQVQNGARAAVRRALFERNRRIGVVVDDANTELTLEDAVVRDTQSQESDRGGVGLVVWLGARTEVRRALFERNREVGVFVEDADTALTLEDVIVRDTQSQESGQQVGRGLNVQRGARAEVRRALFDRNRDIGVYVGGANTELTLEDAVIRDTQSQESDQTGGRGLGVELGARADVRRALFERNREGGVVVDDADTSLILKDAVVRDTQSQESDQALGRGLQVQDGARAEVRRSLFERNREFGVVVGDADTLLTMEDAVVRDTQSQESDQTSGLGLIVQFGARAEVRRALFERNRGVGVFVGRAGSALTLEDAVVRDTQSQESDQTGGTGLSVQDGARAEVRRALFERNRQVGVVVLDANTALTLEDVVVRDTQSQESDRTGGRGLEVQLGARAAVRRALFERNRALGVLVDGADTALTFEDAVVRDTQSQESDRRGGLGLGVQSAARAEVRGALFERNRATGVLVSSANSELTLEDALVRDTQSQQSDRTIGRGLSVQDGARADVRRSLFERNREVGVIVLDASTSLTFEDALVRDTQSQESDQALGRGLNVQLGARADVRRVRLENSREFGFFAILAGAISLTDVHISGTRDPPCVEDFSCLPNADALAALGGEPVVASRVTLDDSAQCGLRLIASDDPVPVNPLVELTESLVANNRIGACIQAFDYPLGTISDPTVEYLNNERLIETVDLPRPRPADPVDPIDDGS